MSIQVNNFQWEPGKNDAEYIKLLESSRDEWQKIAQKAIAKLKALSKAQKPRVMTLDELVMWQKQPVIERDPIYVEYREGKGFGAPHWAMDNFGFNVATCQDNYKSAVYGMLVRCWTFRPTDAQREATLWNA